MACGGSKGRVLETQGFPVLSSGDPLRQVVWPSFLFVGHPSKEPDSGLRPELSLGLSAYQVLASDPSVLGEHDFLSQLRLGGKMGHSGPH